jgi:hypothetical protein
MKYIKQYENNSPNKFDYVIVIHNNKLEIAQITSVVISPNPKSSYIIVEFDDNTGRTYHYNKNEIKYWSENLENCINTIPILNTSDKFNI